MGFLFWLFVIDAILVWLGFGAGAWLVLPLAIILWLKTMD